MERMHYYIDTHDRANGTFPADLTAGQLRDFVAAFEQACRAEDVVILRLHVALEAGRAYCLTLAPSAEAVRRAHERVGLPYDGITEVATITPADLFLADPVAAPTAGTPASEVMA